MVKRAPTPPPAEDDPHILAITHPYPPNPNFDRQQDILCIVFWLACCIGEGNFDNLYSICYKPTAGDVVLIEVRRGFRGYRRLLGAHRWSEFVRNTAQSRDDVSCVYFSSFQDCRAVEKAGWRRIFVEDKWFKQLNVINRYIAYPYPPSGYCLPPAEDQTTSRMCTPLPLDLFDMNKPAPPPIPVGSAQWTEMKEADAAESSAQATLVSLGVDVLQTVWSGVTPTRGGGASPVLRFPDDLALFRSGERIDGFNPFPALSIGPPSRPALGDRSGSGSGSGSGADSNAGSNKSNPNSTDSSSDDDPSSSDFQRAGTKKTKSHTTRTGTFASRLRDQGHRPIEDDWGTETILPVVTAGGSSTRIGGGATSYGRGLGSGSGSGNRYGPSNGLELGLEHELGTGNGPLDPNQKPLCPTHGIVCRKAICNDYRKLINKMVQEKVQMEKQAERMRKRAASASDWRARARGGYSGNGNGTGTGRGRGVVVAGAGASAGARGFGARGGRS